MFKHHEETIRNISEKLKKRDDVLAVLIGGSIAHGFATEESDVDLMIIVSEEDYERRKKAGDLHYYETEACTYEKGYIDGKYINIDFINKVAEYGSEPARFAFKDAIIAFTRVDALENLIVCAAKYPVEKKNDNLRRFYAQLHAWNWFCYEAIKHNNKYLLNHAVSNLVLFGGRMILAYNEEIYPYHKWFLRVLGNVRKKPEDLMKNIDNLVSNQTAENIDNFYKCILNFVDWDIRDLDWPSQFMVDSEWNWMDIKMNIADI